MCIQMIPKSTPVKSVPMDQVVQDIWKTILTQYTLAWNPTSVMNVDQHLLNNLIWTLIRRAFTQKENISAEVVN